MSDSRHPSVSSSAEPAALKIPTEAAEEIRRLSHDLSNALEIILQTSYLLGITESGPIEDSRKWREMLDQAVQQAAKINRDLREYIRLHS